MTIIKNYYYYFLLHFILYSIFSFYLSCGLIQIKMMMIIIIAAPLPAHHVQLLCQDICVDWYRFHVMLGSTRRTFYILLVSFMYVCVCDWLLLLAALVDRWLVQRTTLRRLPRDKQLVTRAAGRTSHELAVWAAHRSFPCDKLGSCRSAVNLRNNTWRD